MSVRLDNQKKNTPEKQQKRERYRFLLTKIAQGWIWLALIIGVFLLLRLFRYDFYGLLEPLYNKPFWIYFSFVVSEVFFGIVPPEFYMVWARGYGNPVTYAEIILLLTAISYGAGIAGYFIGRTFSHTRFYRRFSSRRLAKVNPLLKKYGIFLLVVASLTPVPYSATCMLVGSVRTPFLRFLAVSSFRFLRFGIYGVIIWKSAGL